MSLGPVGPFDLPNLEEKVLARWRDDDLVAQIRKKRAGAKQWVFYEGPPTANGRPGLHHVWARVFKDLYPRFQTMRGHYVPRKGGWDCHGLPVELEVEKELGLTSKNQIESYGVAEFNQRCRESVQRYVGDWTSLTERSGTWIDTEDAYWTLNNSYIESVWWLVKQLWDKGLLYEGHRVSPYCPRCGTALSSHEMGQPGVYQDVTDPSAYVRFPLQDRDADLMVWTTTPWTLISNVAAAVGPEITYVQINTGSGRDLIMAETAAARFFDEESPYREIWRGKGSELVGWRYKRPFDLLEIDDSAQRVVAAEYVSTEDGSGIVHLAPAFGEEDASIGRVENLPVLNPVGPDGAFLPGVGQFSGKDVKACDPAIISDLDKRGLLVRSEPYVHSYPHCWRCNTPLIYWAKTSWFARTGQYRDQLQTANNAVNWHPEHIKAGRFGKWLEGNVDWALSRDRYWGTPLPIWRCSSGHDTCIGSVEELSGLSGKDLSELDLHRPHIDDITFSCPHDSCSQLANRLAPVLDAWFDSGSMPSAQHHYPFENQDLFQKSFPADFICEAIDQTRGWFYTLLAVNAAVFGTSPYKNVVCLSLIVDSEGQKMSKSKGNVIDPWQIFDTHGADALRWYFFSAGQPWTPRRVFEEGIRESTRQTLLTLWNVYSFFTTYATLDGWEPPGDHASSPSPTHVLDRWVLGELDDTVIHVTEALEGFDALGATTRIARFVDDLSNWYVRRSRPRFWQSSDDSAHATLYRCLVVTAELMAPFCPLLADEIWTSLTGGLSVHATDWPKPIGNLDASLAQEMEAARRLVALGRSARTDAKTKVRQPLSRALLLHPGVELGPEVRAEISEELNVKALEDIDTLNGLVHWSVVPNFRLLGPRLGAGANEVKAALATMDGSALQRDLETQGFIQVGSVRLSAEEVEVRAERHGDFALSQENSWAVALDLELNDDLRIEGMSRELVRALNDLRKELGLEISDRIAVQLGGDDHVMAAVRNHRDWIANEILAVELTDLDDGSTPEHTLTIDDFEVAVNLKVAKTSSPGNV